MGKSDFIDELLGNEDLPDLTPSKVMPKIELTPSAEILEETKSKARPLQKDSSPEVDGIERREFTRVDILDRQLELKFSNDLQFAKQYIENISLGGLFVKTSKKHEMGTLVPIEFSIPSRDGSGKPRSFNLTGKVCRITPQGIGLEFTNLSHDIRLELEAFVRAILPKGVALNAKAKSSSVDRLEKIREEKALAQKRLRRHALHLLSVGLLMVINWIAYQDLKETSEVNAVHSRVEKVTIGDHQIDHSSIRSISRNSNGLFTIYLDNGESIVASQDQMEKNLPYDLRVDARILTSIPLVKPKRTSNTAQTLRLER